MRCDVIHKNIIRNALCLRRQKNYMHTLQFLFDADNAKFKYNVTEKQGQQQRHRKFHARHKRNDQMNAHEIDRRRRQRQRRGRKRYARWNVQYNNEHKMNGERIRILDRWDFDECPIVSPGSRIHTQMRRHLGTFVDSYK